MNKDDKAICKMIALYLDRATDAIEQLSPDGAHELAVAMSSKGLPHEGDLKTLTAALNKLSK